MFYDSAQFSRDIKTLIYTYGEHKPHGFFSMQVVKKGPLLIENRLDRIAVYYEGKPVEKPVLMDSRAAQAILHLAVNLEN